MASLPSVTFSFDGSVPAPVTFYVMECLDHLLIFQEKQLQRVLNEYAVYFNRARPPQGIGQQIPEPSRSALSSQDAGNNVIAFPVMGGLHHDYHWAA